MARFLFWTYSSKQHPYIGHATWDEPFPQQKKRNMLQRDYIQRMIEQFGELLKRVVSLRLEGKAEEALEEMDSVYDSYFPFEAALVRNTPIDEMDNFLADFPDLEEDHWSILAEILKEEAENSYSRGEWQAGDEAILKAIHILQHLNAADPLTFSFDRNNKITLWKKLHKGSSSPE